VRALFIHLWTGLIFFVVGPRAGADSDSALFQNAGLYDKLRTVNVRLQEDLNLGSHPLIVGDAGFAGSEEVLTPWSRQQGLSNVERLQQEMFNFYLCEKFLFVSFFLIFFF
jgi:hypothetical protein